MRDNPGFSRASPPVSLCQAVNLVLFVVRYFVPDVRVRAKLLESFPVETVEILGT